MLHLGVDERHERMGGTIGVPEGEGGVELLAVAGIAEERGGRHGVVESGVEDGTVGGCASCHTDLLQLRVPFSVGLSHDGAEVPCGELSLQVGSGSPDAGGRKTYAHLQRLGIVGKREDGDAIALAGLKADGARELCHEVDALVGGPPLRVAVAADGGGILHLGLTVGEGVPADAVLQVKTHIAPLRVGRQGVALQAASLGGGELYMDAAVERHAIVAGAHSLGSV